MDQIENSITKLVLGWLLIIDTQPGDPLADT